MLETIIHQLEQKQDLNASQIPEIINSLVNENISPQIKAAFLTALAQKGETVEEISAFTRELRERSIRPELPPEISQSTFLDIVGTGGDRLNTFNISTASAIIVAAAGVYIAKHGNRAITSQCGSADVLNALGIPTDIPAKDAGAFLLKHHFVFLFAPLYHPAFKHLAPARKICAEKGQRTLFNFLGPLLNPMRPSAQMVGTSRPDLCEPLARVLQALGVRHASVVCGRVGDACMDEFSILGANKMASFIENGPIAVSENAYPDYLVPNANLEQLKGGSPQENAEIIIQLLQAKDKGPRRHIVLLNAGAALITCGRAATMTEAQALAAELIDSGKAFEHLKSITKGC